MDSMLMNWFIHFFQYPRSYLLVFHFYKFIAKIYSIIKFIDAQAKSTVFRYEFVKFFLFFSFFLSFLLQLGFLLYYLRFMHKWSIRSLKIKFHWRFRNHVRIRWSGWLFSFTWSLVENIKMRTLNFAFIYLRL